MASKSKQKRLNTSNRKETATLAVFISIVAALLALIQNSYGQFSDIRGFYGLHFQDGQNLWPFSTHQLLGAAEPIHPVEYPALTGLIMWLFSFFIEPAQNAWITYFRLTASTHIVIFAFTTYFVHKIAGRRWSILFAVSPAVLYSLNRNWDIWAVALMILAIYLFEKGKEKQSAILLAISIATKFFPLVLLFPIFIFYFRQNNLKKFISYFLHTVGAWVLINLPFVLINFRGWSYFYEFSYSRPIGSASVWDISSRLNVAIPSDKITFYLLNLGIFVLLGIYLLKSRIPVPLAESAFLTMFAFILFNKQYSMQYVIWLSALAVIAISYLNEKHKLRIIYLYVVWQLSEIVFQYFFFQNILTDYSPETTNPAISGFAYGLAGVLRYLAIVGFTTLLAVYIYAEKKAKSHIDA
jgi:uncharacterized membrane protein